VIVFDVVLVRGFQGGRVRDGFARWNTVNTHFYFNEALMYRSICPGFLQGSSPKGAGLYLDNWARRPPRIGNALLGLLVVACCVSAAAASSLTIDTFGDSPGAYGTTAGAVPDGSGHTTFSPLEADLAGGVHREVAVDVFGSGASIADCYVGGGTFQAGTCGLKGTLVTLTYTGLNTDLTAGSTNNSLLLDFLNIDPGAQSATGLPLTVTVTGTAGSATAVALVPGSVSPYTPFEFAVPFSSFTGNLAALTGARNLVFKFNDHLPAPQPDVDFTLQSIQAAKYTVPEPGAWALLVAGALGLAGWGWRRSMCRQNLSSAAGRGQK
jgi:hypothetical protein